MKRNYIGLACTGHDNALAIVNSEGEVVFAEGTERYLQNKRAFNCPPDDLIKVGSLIERYCEPGADLVVVKTWSDNAIRIFEEEFNITEQRIQEIEPNEFAYLKSIDIAIYQYVIRFVSNNINNSGNHLLFRSQQNVNRQVICKSYDHHLTHAAAGCYTSQYENAACLIVDGFGEGVSVSSYAYQNGKIKELDRGRLDGDLTKSLGAFYDLLCGLCGFDGWAGEAWKVMGLAPYGKMNHNIYDLLRQRVCVEGVTLQSPKESSSVIAELLSFARKPNEPVIAAADLAYTGQLVFCEIFTELLHNFYELGISENLVLGGGCALNSSCNGQVVEKTKFKNLHVFSAPADDGNAVGAALLAFYEDNPNIRPIPYFQSPYLGSTMAEDTLNNVKKFSRIPNFSTHRDTICKKTAALLTEGKIIGWVQGRAEFGPRALGNRSILAAPNRTDMKDKINALVKFREEFRPFAPSIMHEFGEEYFVNYQESPYMERTLTFREEVRAKVPAVVHVDGTGRLQTVKREWNEKYYDLIKAFYDMTGIPLLLNTSLNIMGKPIIHSVEDAIAQFYTTGLDALIIEDCLIEKE